MPCNLMSEVCVRVCGFRPTYLLVLVRVLLRYETAVLLWAGRTSRGVAPVLLNRNEGGERSPLKKLM